MAFENHPNIQLHLVRSTPVLNFLFIQLSQIIYLDFLLFNFRLAGQLRYMDSRPDEQVRQI